MKREGSACNSSSRTTGTFGSNYFPIRRTGSAGGSGAPPALRDELVELHRTAEVAFWWHHDSVKRRLSHAEQAKRHTAWLAARDYYVKREGPPTQARRAG